MASVQDGMIAALSATRVAVPLGLASPAIEQTTKTLSSRAERKYQGPKGSFSWRKTAATTKPSGSKSR